jgi:hypothetical protein
LGKILKIKRKSLFNFSSYSHPEIWEFQGVTALPRGPRPAMVLGLDACTPRPLRFLSKNCHPLYSFPAIIAITIITINGLHMSRRFHSFPCTVWPSIFPSSSSKHSRVRKTGGNRSGSTGSRWNRSSPVHEPVRFPPKNRAYKFAIPVNRPVSPENHPVFADSQKPLPGGFVNPETLHLYWPLNTHAYMHAPAPSLYLSCMHEVPSSIHLPRMHAPLAQETVANPPWPHRFIVPCRSASMIDGTINRAVSVSPPFHQ